MPAAFTYLNFVEDSPLYSYGFGIFIALTFAWLLGFGATLAEPALNALLSASGDADGQITVEYETKIIAAAL